MANLQIKIGEKFGRLTLLRYAEKTDRYLKGIFICDCGKETTTRISRVFSGNCKSCGCLNKEMAKAMCDAGLSVKHGLYSSKNRHKLSNVHNAINTRCYNENCPTYSYYGGRGIFMCEEWRHNVVAFTEWANSNGYRDGLEIDRIDNNKGYSPENCRFVDRKKNMNNMRANNIIEYRGEKFTVSEWCDKLGISYSAFYSRVNRGWSTDRSFTQPYRPSRQ